MGVIEMHITKNAIETISNFLQFDVSINSRFWQLLRTQVAVNYVTLMLVGIRRRFCQLGIDIDVRVNYLVSNKRVRSKYVIGVQ